MIKQCDNCSNNFEYLEHYPEKRFCSSYCRTDYHNDRRAIEEREEIISSLFNNPPRDGDQFK